MPAAFNVHQSTLNEGTEMTLTEIRHPEDDTLEEIDQLLAVMRDLAAADETLAAWSIGYVVGWLAGQTGDRASLDEVLEAKGHPYAATYDHPTASGRWEMLGRNGDQPVNLFRACGVLSGWFAGTADRHDSDVCTTCDGRILTLSEGFHCQDHGWFCAEDSCARAVCDPRCARIGY
jgi:hypothetical protein